MLWMLSHLGWVSEFGIDAELLGGETRKPTPSRPAQRRAGPFAGSQDREKAEQPPDNDAGASRAKFQSRPVAIHGRALAHHNEEYFPRVPTADPT